MKSTEGRELRTASTRLALQFAGIILVLFVVLGAVVYVVVSAGQAEAAKRALADASMVDSVHDTPHDLLITVVTGQSRESSPNMPKGLPDEAALARVSAGGPSETSIVQAGGSSYLTQTNVRRGRVVQVSYGLAEQAEELERLLTALIVSGIIAALAAAALAVFIARRAMRPLADALALQRRFVADASHELRTPLTLLSTRAQLLRRRIRDASLPIDDAVSSDVDEIVADSRALGEIVEDLLTVADPRQDAVTENVDLGEAAAAVMGAADARALDRGVRIEVASTGKPSVQGAVVSLRRMLVALVDNAVDHAKSRVLIAVSVEGRDAVIRVSDDGPGFATGSEKRVFERFASTRPQSTVSAEPRHYGLGLALVAEVVGRHHGTVAASNGASGGAVVTVRLPASRQAEKEQPSPDVVGEDG